MDLTPVIYIIQIVDHVEGNTVYGRSLGKFMGLTGSFHYS